MLRSADELLAPAVAASVAGLELAPSDAAVVRLAQSYAAAIDGAEDPRDALEKLGPKLLAALQALQATPAARARRRPQGGGSAGPNRLQALRDARGA